MSEFSVKFIQNLMLSLFQSITYSLHQRTEEEKAKEIDSRAVICWNQRKSKCCPWEAEKKICTATERKRESSEALWTWSSAHLLMDTGSRWPPPLFLLYLTYDWVWTFDVKTQTKDLCITHDWGTEKKNWISPLCFIQFWSEEIISCLTWWKGSSKSFSEVKISKLDFPFLFRRRWIRNANAFPVPCKQIIVDKKLWYFVCSFLFLSSYSSLETSSKGELNLHITLYVLTTIRYKYFIFQHSCLSLLVFKFKPMDPLRHEVVPVSLM